MLLLGHTGLTLGAAILLNRALSKYKNQQPEDNAHKSAKVSIVKNKSNGGMKAWFVSPGNLIDIRMLFIGSLLPDIIDKPLGYLVFRETLSNLRTYSHTLLFFIIITLAGYLVYRYRRQTWLLALSFGTLTHLIGDYMWLTPKTLFWPLFGTGFVEKDIGNWFALLLDILLHDPYTYIPEIAGGIIILLFLYVVVRNRKLVTFVKHGKINNHLVGQVKQDIP